MAQLGTFSYTSRLLNYVEPYYIDGVAKTAFYTEVNTNIFQDDKVFITNGYYDSETLYISRGKYVKNADGYTVLYANNCQVVVDVNWNGATQSYDDDNFDNYLKVYHITSQREFDYINKLYVNTYQTRYSKFELNYTNNIIYADSAYLGNYGANIGRNNGLTSPEQFWARLGLTWINVTNEFNLNSFTFSNDYYAAGLTCNGRMYVMGEDFTYGNKTYKQRNVYKYGTSLNSWEIDIQYKQPIISKLYFKEGIFRGIHNDGVFGSYVGKEQDWYGTQSTWNSGFFVNSNWHFGLMNSKSVNTNASYYCTLKDGKPLQTTDFSNNRGFGYNYILDSNVYTGELVNGNFINCNIGPTSVGFTAIDGYFGVNNNYQLLSLGGLFEYCNVNNSELSNSTTLDSIVVNSYLKNSSTLNSQILESYSNGGEFSISNDINVISSDLMGYVPSYIGSSTTNINDLRGILKLYISDDDYNRLDIFDNFYITQINKNYILSSLTTDQKILLPFETRYVLDTFFDFKVNGVNQDCLVSLKGKIENRYKVEVTFDGVSNYYNTFSSNKNTYSSIDIDLGQYLAYFKNLSNIYTYLHQNIITTDNVQTLFLNTSITNSDFKDGVMEQITWTSGSNVNYPSNIIKINNGQLSISKYSNNEIEVVLNETTPFINDNHLSVGSYVWLDSIYQIDSITNVVTNISSIQPSIPLSQAVYTITHLYQDTNGINPMVVRLYNPTLIGPLSVVGTYFIKNSTPNYASINKLLIDSSTIKSGLFERTLFTDTTFNNDSFNNLDTNISLSNVNLLRLVNLIFDNNNNTVNSGVIHKSHLMSVIWNSGILNNSIWNGPSFSNGVFNNGYWVNGIFNGGYFQNSKGIGLTSVDYSYENHYNSWLNGIFNNGYFYNSAWLSGIFNNGKLYNSDWYAGTWNYGVLGDKNIPTTNTTLGSYMSISGVTGGTQSIWNDGIVDNAQVGGDGIVYWYGGNFNNGIFTSNGTTPSVNESIWYGGNFNGGNFTKLARWKNGTFNKGKFASIYGWTMSTSTYSTDYSWENGIFKGGQFGNADYTNNSTWYYGEFDGGIFQAKVWNDGVFQNGNFNGGATYSASADESSFTESFTQSYYGLWRNGWLVDVKHKAILDQLLPTNNLRNSQKLPDNLAVLQNILWLNGTFDHSSGTLKNSAWLNGTFSNGQFTGGVFNPYVNRSWWNNSYKPQPAFNFNLDQCLWLNGKFDGLFYISDWHDGTFLSGTMSGARFMNGIWNYGYARNIYFESGTWNNGIWDGDPFDYNNLLPNNDMVYSKDRDIILRNSNILNNGLVHISNAFSGSISTEQLLQPNPLNFAGWTYSSSVPPLTPNWQPYVYGSGFEIPTISSNSPSMNVTDPYIYPYNFLIQVGPYVNAGDRYVVVVNGVSVQYIALPGDTPSSVAGNLYINSINTYYYSYGWLTTTCCYGYGDNFSLQFPNAYYYLYTNVFPASTGNSYNTSEILYAISTGLTTSIFTQGNTYNISLTVGGSLGRTDFLVYIGDQVYTQTTYDGDTFNYSYSPAVTPNSQKLGVQRVMYPNPDNSSFVIFSASVKEVNSTYNDTYNNKLFQFSGYTVPFQYGPTGASVSLPSLLNQTGVSNNGVLSLKFGNGVFKSGIWKGGFWNNGWRSTWDGSDDIVYFSDVSQVLQISSNLWHVRLDLAPIGDLSQLNVGDNVGIGNLVYIDINENRKLIKNYYRIVNITPINITVEVSTNLPIRRIVKDSDNHFIYVTKNIWVSGAFLSGYFRGVWNYGLFKGFPYITEMQDSVWIDGVFDGGRFTSTQSYYSQGGVNNYYNTGLIQNFTFRDNNIAGKNQFLYNSWIDVNYFTSSMTNIAKGNYKYDSTKGVIIADGNLKGFPTVDILSSDSIFRNSYDLDSQYYKLGWSYKVYVDYLGNASYFTYPLSTKSVPGIDTFLLNGWTFSNNSSSYHSNTGNNDDGELVMEYYTQTFTNIGIKAVQTAAILYFQDSLNIGNSFLSNHYKGDFSDTPASSVQYNNQTYGFTYSPIGGSPVYITTSRFSNLSFTASQWHFNNNSIVSANIGYYNPSYLQYPSQTPAFNGSYDGDTDNTHKRVYMMDWFRLDSTDTTYGGYVNYGTFSNLYNSYTTHTDFGTMTFSAYAAPHTSTYIINAFVPFSFWGDEGDSSRGGWSAFKLVGVVESCPSGLPASVDSNWQLQLTTKLKYYGNSAETSAGNTIGLDYNSCAIAWDGGMGQNFVGGLYINGQTINLNAGDLVRFRLYFVNTRKLFATSGTRSPGFFYFKIGTDSIMSYTQNNHGYFEINDVASYVNANTNILDNTFTSQIPRLRYSVVDFQLDYVSPPEPHIYLLSNDPQYSPMGASSVSINHADAVGRRTEYFYNRSSLQLFFNSSQQFSANFSRISFYETDMIPFFNYFFDNSKINNYVVSPYYGASSSGISFDNTITINGGIYSVIGATG